MLYQTQWAIVNHMKLQGEIRPIIVARNKRMIQKNMPWWKKTTTELYMAVQSRHENIFTQLSGLKSAVWNLGVNTCVVEV